MVEVQRHGHIGAGGSGGHHAVEVVEAGSLDGTRGGLHDNGRLGLLRGGEDRHHELEVLDIEGTHSVVVLLRVEQHLLSGNEHCVSSPCQRQLNLAFIVRSARQEQIQNPSGGLRQKSK